MALSDIIATIISRSSAIEICDTLHDAQIATTEEDLITAGLPLVVYTYQMGIVDDTLLASFTEANLNAQNIYTTGTFTLTNPASDIYILKEANVTVNMTGNNKCKINVCGSGILNLVAGDNSYTTIKGYGNAVINATVGNNAIVNISATDDNTGTVTLNDNSICQLIQSNSSNLTFANNNSSFLNAILWGQSVLNYSILDTATVTAVAKESATINTSEF